MKKLSLIFILPIILFSCNNNDFKIKNPENSDIYGLTIPVKLDFKSTIIHLTDFFVEPKVIDSISLNNFFEIKQDTVNNTIIINQLTDNVPFISELKFFVKEKKYSVLLFKNQKKNIVVKYESADNNIKKVGIAGEMNGWNPDSLKFIKKDSIWEANMLLNPGKFQYKIVVDGKWMLDPNNNDSTDNGNGAYNSVLTVGSKKGLKPEIYSVNSNKNQILIESENDISEIFALWQNHLIPIKKSNNKNRFRIILPKNIDEIEKSFIRIWAYNENGISNDILIPILKGKVIENTEQLTRKDKHSFIMYFMMVDRFFDGDSTNNKPVKDPEISPKANFYGGDLQGIKSKIESGYFSYLGINTIWVSPIVQNPLGAYGQYPNPKTKFSAYHGYWPISSTKVDDRFGGEQGLKDLIDIAHDKNINILVDYVANHVHKEHPIYINHPDWATSLYLPDGTMNTEKWDEHRLTTWFDVFLPTLDFSKPEVVDALTDSALFWFENYQIDGFRHDATKHIPEKFWRTLTYKLKKRIMIPNNRDVFQIGETYGSPELISSYVNSGELEGQFDFNVYDAAVSAFANTNSNFENLNNRILESLKYYGYHNLMGYITGNQDRARFISYADGSVSFAEDAKYAGWTRNIQIKDTVGYQKLAELTAFMMTIPGIPVIYYGDEIGMPGGNDPDNRRMMKFDNLNQNQKNHLNNIKKLINLRKNKISLVYGDFKTIKIEKDIYAFIRTYFDKTAIIIFNKSSVNQDITIDISKRVNLKKLSSNFNSEFKLDENILKINLKANSFEILTN
ncbi:MAG: hypothetical protein JXR51_05585 [Bacteroidales bacterium]|nr:hypothetical protein [Bacteroidales bacterium]MBN2756631.1 hypothetical protein [Bacteroidales bacterium]